MGTVAAASAERLRRGRTLRGSPRADQASSNALPEKDYFSGWYGRWLPCPSFERKRAAIRRGWRLSWSSDRT